MAKTDITPKLWRDLKEIQASMAISEFDMTDEQLEKMGLSYIRSGASQKFKLLKERADREGLDYNALVIEEFGLKNVKIHN